MKIGLSYDLKEKIAPGQSVPEDAFEEYDSPETVAGLTAAIEAQGHSVVRLGGGREFLVNILHESVDFVFNIAEGRGTYRSREAQVPSVLEMLNIPYSGADPQCLAICLDKPLTKKLVALAGVATPKEQVITDIKQLKALKPDALPLPAFIKPIHEGSSMGVRLGSRVETPAQAAEVAARLLEHYRQPVMAEEFIAGDEVTVGLVGNPPQVLGIMRILPKQKMPYFAYSLEVKRDWENLVEYECPARLDARILDKISDSSFKAFEVLGCRDFARVDFRLGADGTPYFLEINPLAGLNPKSSDLVIMARKMGWTYEALISTILDAALARYQRANQSSHRL
ncbi:MAG: D-alanine--D-alanine ligase [Chloroflexota bacterium]|nr:D-alanine--D-alanine ligase [Chloroflexota bacterium]